ncbi:hypothetical protein C8J56DRAFT_896405 [Mycena floridula]|nr:hypothetical protein C8J56DRAFT_896405 [Mycena floridula]
MGSLVGSFEDRRPSFHSPSLTPGSWYHLLIAIGCSVLGSVTRPHVRTRLASADSGTDHERSSLGQEGWSESHLEIALQNIHQGQAMQQQPKDCVAVCFEDLNFTDADDEFDLGEDSMLTAEDLVALEETDKCLAEELAAEKVRKAREFQEHAAAEAEKFRKATAATETAQNHFSHHPCFAADSDNEDVLDDMVIPENVTQGSMETNEDNHPLPSQIKESTGIDIDLPSITSVPPSQIHYDSVPPINVVSSSHLFHGQYCYSQSEYD